VSPQSIREILIQASKDENVDIHIVIQLLYHYKSLQVTMGAKSIKDITPYRDLVRACREAIEIGGKPVVLILPNIRQEEEDIGIEEMLRETRRLFTEAGMPVYDDVGNALRAVASVSRFYRSRQ